MAQKWMRAGDELGGVERGRARCDAVRCEGGLGGRGNWFRSERMRQGFESGVVFEREVNAFISFDEDEDARGGGD
jgi:hypothetical protein